MKAMVFKEYGLANVLHIQEVDRPVPKANEVLVKVHAVAVNEWDWGLLRGVPFVNRMSLGIFRPKKINILGCDVAGCVEAVGKDVKRFKQGDEVFGDLSGGSVGDGGWGGFAEYLCASENLLSLKPDCLTFEQAAAVPQAGMLALQGLLKGQINQQQQQPLQKVLINGASGGVGSFAVQIAKSYGAEVTGVCSTGKLDFVRSLGADHLIDYTQNDFTNSGYHYDLILDVMGFHSIFDCRRALSAQGKYVMLGGATSRALQVLFIGPLLSLFGDQKMSLLLLKPNDGLDKITTLFETGEVTPVIDKIFPLSDGVEAMRYYSEGHTKGKVVITMDES